MKDFTVFICVTCFLLGGFVASCGAQGTIYRPPENTTACRGDNVTISCNYASGIAFPVTWIINGTPFDEETLNNSPLYQLNPKTPALNSLTVFYINGNTTFQCMVQFTINTTFTSTPGTVTVIDVPKVQITTAIGGCGYVNVSWTVIGSNDVCQVVYYTVKLLSSTKDELDSKIIDEIHYMFNELPFNTLFYVTVFSHNAVVALSNSVTTSMKTLDFKEPIPINVMANMKITNEIIVITVSWKIPNCTTANITKYNITVMDMYSSASVTVPANMSSVEISEFPDNDTSIVANREYTITVSAISDQGTSYPSVPVVVSINDGDSDSGGSSGGAIAGGVIGGIIAVVVIVIIIIVIYYFCFYKKKSKSLYYDDTMNLKSPTGTGGSHALGGDSQTDAFYDKVVYSDPAQTMTVPHQTSATGDQYAVSTKATNYANQEQLPSREYEDTCNTKTNSRGVTYADLQELPTDSEKNMLDDHTSAVTYSQIA